MEKTVVFGPMIIFMAVFGLMIFLFVGIILKLVFKAKNEFWQGTISEKNSNSVEDSDTETTLTYYYIVVKENDGKERKVALSEKLWRQFEVGQKIIKPKGKLWPEKG